MNRKEWLHISNFLPQVKSILKNKRLPLQTVAKHDSDHKDTDRQLKNSYKLSNTTQLNIGGNRQKEFHIILASKWKLAKYTIWGPLFCWFSGPFQNSRRKAHVSHVFSVIRAW